MERVLEPEWLDELPPQDPRAVRSRADLRRVNWMMANARLLAGTLSPAIRNGAKVADLGSGDGHLMLRVARRLPYTNIELALVDRAPVVSASTLAAYEALGWKARVVARDALDYVSHEKADVIVANLFLHHLDDASLRKVFAAQRARMLVACEPRRSALAVAGCRLMWLIGCNDVTRHDALVSVRAGFRGDELSRLWPADRGWRLEERGAPPFSHLFVARRDAL